MTGAKRKESAGIGQRGVRSDVETRISLWGRRKRTGKKPKLGYFDCQSVRVTREENAPYCYGNSWGDRGGSLRENPSPIEPRARQRFLPKVFLEPFGQKGHNQEKRVIRPLRRLEDE